MLEIAREPARRAGVIAEHKHAAARCRVETLFLVAIETVVAEAVTEGHACRRRVVLAGDARPQDLHGGAAGPVIEPGSKPTEVLSPDAVDCVATDADQVDASIRLDAEQGQGLGFFTGKCGFGHRHRDGATRAFVEFGREARERFAFHDRNDDAAVLRPLEGTETDGTLRHGGDGQQQ